MTNININFNFDQKSGGGLSFLSILREYLLKKKIYCHNILFSKYIIMNSHHKVFTNLLIKIFSHNKVFIHRIDGPIQLYDSPKNHRDKLVNILNIISDFDIYQSNWSRHQNLKLKVTINKDFRIIHNGSKISDKKLKNNNTKTKIIISSFSNNQNKGFMFYKYLDDNIDFSKFEIHFYGNTDTIFKNIKNKGFVPHEVLINKICLYDLAINASMNDPCSNFLIECLNSKIDVLALNSGGHIELITNKNSLFTSKDELLKKIKNFKKKKYFNKTFYPIQHSCENYIELILNLEPNKKDIFNELFILLKFIRIIIDLYIYKFVNFFKKSGAM